MDQALRLDQSISTLLRVLIIDERRFSANLGTTPFNPLDLETLTFVGMNPNCGAKDVADYLAISPTTMQSVLDRLEKRGLVHRNKAILKGRSVALSLTQQGTECREQLQAQNLKNCSQMLNYLPEDARPAFVANMTRIAAAFS